MVASFPSSTELTRQLKLLAQQQGFARVGICPAQETPGLARFHEWLRRGYAGEMRYLTDRSAAYAHPRHVLDGVRSLVMLAMDYDASPPDLAAPGSRYGRVARYAWGEVDYHDLIHNRLQRMLRQLNIWRPQAVARGVVDTAPLHEREFARLAGLGWIGKNTLLIHPQSGSWCFLAALLTDEPLDYDAPFVADHCGTCTACLDACPTQAFPAPYVLDATQCISYLTIELRDAVPEPQRDSLGDWVFGCDVCQEVCPWNRFAPGTCAPQLMPAPTYPLDLRAVFYWSESEFRHHFRHTALWRTKRRGLLRNAALVLGVKAPLAASAALLRGLRDHEPLVRGASAWALGRGRHQSHVRRKLLQQAARETDPQVRREIRRAVGA